MKYCFVLTTVLFALCACTSMESRYSPQELSFDIVQEYISLSNEYSELQNYEKALQLLFQAKDFDSQSTELSYMIARTAALAEHWETALEYYEEILLLDAENLIIKKSIAWVYAQSGDVDTAVTTYEKLYTEYNYDKEITTNYILVLIAHKDYSQAELILESFAVMYPEESNLEDLREEIESKKSSLTPEPLQEQENNGSESIST